jgi:hypothetical protein
MVRWKPEETSRKFSICNLSDAPQKDVYVKYLYRLFYSNEFTSQTNSSYSRPLYAQVRASTVNRNGRGKLRKNKLHIRGTRVSILGDDVGC